MKVRLLCFVVLHLSSLLFASSKETQEKEEGAASSSSSSSSSLDFSVIEGASYFVRSEEDRGVLKYYSFDGEFLKEVYHPAGLKGQRRRIDKDAPKPQPVRANIRYWSGVSLGIIGTKGVPGLFIDFFDKNNNCFKSFRYHTSVIKIFTLVREVDGEMVNFEERNYIIASDGKVESPENFPLDLSICQVDMSMPAEKTPTETPSRRTFCTIL